MLRPGSSEKLRSEPPLAPAGSPRDTSSSDALLPSGMDDEPVLAGALGLVEGLVGGRDQPGRAVWPFGHGGRAADADRHAAEGRARMRDAHRLHVAADPLADAAQAGIVGVGQDDRELLAAE